MKVYTRKGDGGETSLLGGERVGKDDARVDTYGALDELTAVLGVVCSDLDDSDLLGCVRSVQAALFDLGSELATSPSTAPDSPRRSARRVSSEDVAELERWIDQLDAELEPLRTFILPGGARGAAHLHHARAVCRRAERRVVSLSRQAVVSPQVVPYLNRLSDLLFVMARVVNARAGIREPVWVGRER